MSKGAVLCAVVSSDGSRIASGGGYHDNCVRVWRTSSAFPVLQMQFDFEAVNNFVAQATSHDCAVQKESLSAILSLTSLRNVADGGDRFLDLLLSVPALVDVILHLAVYDQETDIKKMAIKIMLTILSNRDPHHIKYLFSKKLIPKLFKLLFSLVELLSDNSSIVMSMLLSCLDMINIATGTRAFFQSEKEWQLDDYFFTEYEEANVKNLLQCVSNQITDNRLLQKIQELVLRANTWKPAKVKSTRSKLET